MEATLEKDIRRLITPRAAAIAGILFGQIVGQADFPHTTPFTLLTGRWSSVLTRGRSAILRPPFEFTGTIHSVTFDVSGDVIRDSEAEMRRTLARQ